MQSPNAAPAASTSASAPPPAGVSGTQPGAAGASTGAPGVAAPDELPPSPPSSDAASTSSKLSAVLLDGEAGAAGAPAAGGCVFASRVRSLPAVQALLGVYAGAKAYPVVGWALAVGEQAASLATAVCRPVNLVCRAPISCGDWCLCKALDVAEAIFPCVSVPPNEVFGQKRDCVTNCICCPPRTAARVLAKICPACSQEN